MVAYRDDSRHATTPTHGSAALATEASAPLTGAAGGAEANTPKLRECRIGGHRVDVDVEIKHRSFHHRCHRSVHLLSAYRSARHTRQTVSLSDRLPRFRFGQHR